MTVELKSVNHRYLDLGIRLPRHIAFVEETLRKTLNETVARGHIEVFLFYRNTRNDARTVLIDQALLNAYLSAARAANGEAQLPDDLTLSVAMRLPDVSSIVEADEDCDTVNAMAREATLQAVAELKNMRKSEGARLSTDLAGRLEALVALIQGIEQRAPQVVEDYKTSLQERIQNMLGAVEVDRARLATEVALFADKASIDEEIVRFRSHLAQAEQLLMNQEPVGRKLDFIVQEMNRELNTIGSKANDAELTNAVLAGKAEIEKIREQVQNIE